MSMSFHIIETVICIFMILLHLALSKASNKDSEASPLSMPSKFKNLRLNLFYSLNCLEVYLSEFRKEK
ncbi:unnamed protein product [Heterobilharzia americana]|nr:unnamed protein product [Heterobilharzia americana]